MQRRQAHNVDPSGMPPPTNGYPPYQQPQQADQFGYYSDPNQFQQPQQTDQFGYYGDPNQFQQPQQVSQDSYGAQPNGNLPQFAQFAAAFNNPIVQGYADGYKKQVYDQVIAGSAQTLKYYFSVDTNYVAKKIGLILCPFLHRDWSTPVSHDGTSVPAKYNINAPDLYIPAMSFLTYVLVAGFVFGTQQRFTPEKLGILTTNALFYLILENAAIFVTKYVLNISHTLSVWHALAYSSYKYVGMVFCLLCYLVGGKTLYYISLAYSVLATVFFLLRSMKAYILDMAYGGDSKKRKVYLLLSITIVQALIIYLLTSSVTSGMSENYDFAKMAMNKMGLKSNDVPMTHDGEVDYEALLKMP